MDNKNEIINSFTRMTDLSESLLCYSNFLNLDIHMYDIFKE